MTFYPRDTQPTDKSRNFLYFQGGPGPNPNTIFYFDVPEWANLIDILVVGPGGNGGSGFSRTAGSAGAGGGGGASGNGQKGIFNANKLPRHLGVCFSDLAQVFIPEGSSSNFTINPISTLLQASGGGNGGNGSSSGTGAGGSIGSGLGQGGQILSVSSSVYATAYTAQSGVAGGNATGAVGASITAFTTGGTPITGGAGGAGCTTSDFAGGVITVTSPLISSSIAAPGGTGNQGQGGVISKYGLLRTGGSGGGSNNSGTGGAGGNGSPGCGGGGGGAGTTGGAGGMGGPGFVEITFI